MKMLLGVIRVEKTKMTKSLSHIIFQPMYNLQVRRWIGIYFYLLLLQGLVVNFLFCSKHCVYQTWCSAWSRQAFGVTDSAGEFQRRFPLRNSALLCEWCHGTLFQVLHQRIGQDWCSWWGQNGTFCRKENFWAWNGTSPLATEYWYSRNFSSHSCCCCPDC